MSKSLSVSVTITVAVLTSTGCIVLSPHGGLALWFPGAGIVAGPGVSPLNRLGPKHFGSGDGESIQTALVLQNFKTDQEMIELEKAYVSISSDHNTDAVKTEIVHDGRTYHVWKWTTEWEGKRQERTMYFDPTNAIRKK